MIVGIDGYPARTSESFHREWRIGAHYFNALSLLFSIGVNAQLHRHPEEIEVLLDRAHDAKAFVIAEAVNRVLGFEFVERWSSPSIARKTR